MDNGVLTLISKMHYGLADRNRASFCPIFWLPWGRDGEATS